MKKILLLFGYHKGTTAQFIKKSISKSNQVVSAGTNRIENETIHDITCTIFEDIDLIIEKCKKEFFDPDIVMFIESGERFIPKNLETLEKFKIFYSIDPHFNLDWHLEFAKIFDLILVGHEFYTSKFIENGFDNVESFPLGYCEETFKDSLNKKFEDREYDISFIGHIDENLREERSFLINSIKEKFSKKNIFISTNLWNEDAAKVYSNSKIVFNHNANFNVISPRVYEGSACGALILTNDFYNIDNYFEIDKEIVTYNKDNLIDTLENLFQNEFIIKEISENGKKRTLNYSFNAKFKDFDFFIDKYKGFSKKYSHKEKILAMSHVYYVKGINICFEELLLKYLNIVDEFQEQKPIYEKLALYYYDIKSFQASIKYCDMILKSERDNFLAQFYKANSYFELMDYKKSKLMYKKLLRQDVAENEENINLYLALSHYYLKEKSQSITLLKKMLQKYPNNSDAKMFLKKIDRPLVSIIVPVYNNLYFLKNLVNSIFKNTFYPNYELILIDNNSEEEGIEEYFESISKTNNVKFILNKENLGFSKANNQGFNLSRAEYVVMLGTDMMVTNNWLNELMDGFTIDEKIAAVQCKLIKATEDAPDSWLVQTCGAKFNEKYLPDYYLADRDPKSDEVNQVFYLEAFMGCGLAIKKDVLNEVSGFDEDYDIVYLEDTDLSLKISEKGYDILYYPNSLIYHFHGISTALLSENRMNKSFQHNINRFKSKWIDNKKIVDILKRVREKIS